MSEICLVTGCGGFLGSHLCERLLAEGHTVVGVDCYTDQFYNYARVQKEANVMRLKTIANFEFVEADLTKVEPVSLMDGVTAVFHCAAQVGPRGCWGRDFATYTRNNILATQMLLEASMQVNRFVLASTLHVYGNATDAASTENDLPRPVSPYGVARLAAEQLAYTYALSYRVPTIALRFGSLYGPRQRPDMLFHRLIRTALEQVGVDILGDGHQKRDFLYVGDAVDACVAALGRGGRGDVINVASGEPRSIRDAIALLTPKVGLASEKIRWQDPNRGDLTCSWADISRAREVLGWAPRTSLDEGIDAEISWIREQVVAAAT